MKEIILIINEYTYTHPHTFIPIEVFTNIARTFNSLINVDIDYNVNISHFNTTSNTNKKFF